MMNGTLDKTRKAEQEDKRLLKCYRFTLLNMRSNLPDKKQMELETLLLICHTSLVANSNSTTHTIIYQSECEFCNFSCILNNGYYELLIRYWFKEITGYFLRISISY